MISCEFVQAPRCPWWTFTYHDKERLALVLGGQGSNLLCRTEDGFRSFKPAKMFDIKDVTTIGDFT